MAQRRELAEAMNLFTDVLSTGFAELGFRRRGRWLYRQRDEAVDVVFIQRARRNGQSTMFSDPDVAYAYV